MKAYKTPEMKLVYFQEQDVVTLSETTTTDCYGWLDEVFGS